MSIIIAVGRKICEITLIVHIRLLMWTRKVKRSVMVPCGTADTLLHIRLG